MNEHIKLTAQLQGNRAQSGDGGMAPLPFAENFTPTHK
jgi:hypothetical protein